MSNPNESEKAGNLTKKKKKKPMVDLTLTTSNLDIINRQISPNKIFIKQD